MRGDFATMYAAASYADVTREVRDELAARIDAAEAAGIAARRSPSTLVSASPRRPRSPGPARPCRLRILRCPILVGVSRKSFVGDRSANLPDRRLPGSLAAGLLL